MDNAKINVATLKHERANIIVLPVIVALIFYFIYPLVKRLLFPISGIIANLFMTFAIPASDVCMFLLALTTNFVITVLAAFLAGMVSSVLFLSRIKKRWHRLGIASAILFMALSYLIMIANIERISSAPNPGFFAIYIVNPIFAGLGLYISIALLSRIRKHLPPDGSEVSDESN